MKFVAKNNVILLLILCFFIQCSSTASKRSFGEVVDDNVIAMKLHTKFIKDKKVKDRLVKMKVWKGVVTLTGDAENQQQINRAIELAEQQRGVREVKSYLALASSSQNGKKDKTLWKVNKKSNNSVQEVDLKPESNVVKVNQKSSKIVKTNVDGASVTPVAKGADQDFQEIEF